ncbi:MAG: flagellar motor switch protein FliN [Methylobacter sp.]
MSEYPDTSEDAGVGDDFEAAAFQEFNEPFDDRGAQADVGDEVNLDVILDVPVTISMEIGRTQINIRNLLQLNQGSVVELERFAGEPLDVLVNGTLIAHGEVVVINDKFGIRLTDVISPSERVKRLA